MPRERVGAQVRREPEWREAAQKRHEDRREERQEEWQTAMTDEMRRYSKARCEQAHGEEARNEPAWRERLEERTRQPKDRPVAKILRAPVRPQPNLQPKIRSAQKEPASHRGTLAAQQKYLPHAGGSTRQEFHRANFPAERDPHDANFEAALRNHWRGSRLHQRMVPPAAPTRWFRRLRPRADAARARREFADALVSMSA